MNWPARLGSGAVALVVACGSATSQSPANAIAWTPQWGSPSTKPIAAHHFGHNTVWSRGGLGLWDDTSNAPSSDVLALVRDLHPGALRFPGGTRAMRYHFDEAIGPASSRAPQCDAFTGQTDATHYGIAEFLALASSLGAEVTLVAPWADGSPQRTAAMVAYANGDPASTLALGKDEDGNDWGVAGDWAKKRASDGHTASWGVTMIEIGNEPYLDLAVGPPSSCGRPAQFKQDQRWVKGAAIPTTAADYAAQLEATAALVRAIDPKIAIGAAAFSSFDGASDAAKEAGDVDRAAGGDAWNARLMTDARDAFDVYVLHPYDLTFTDARVQLGTRLEKTVRDLAALAPDKRIAITEFGFLGGGDTQMNVVASADVIRVAIEAGSAMTLRHVLIEDNPDEPFANSASIFGPAHIKEPSYALMQLLATRFTGQAVPASEVAPDIEGLAAKTSAGISVLLLDRRVDASGPTSVAIALPDGAMQGTLVIMHADALGSNAVTVDPSYVRASGTFPLTLPPNGVAVLSLSR